MYFLFDKSYGLYKIHIKNANNMKNKEFTNIINENKLNDDIIPSNKSDQ